MPLDVKPKQPKGETGAGGRAGRRRLPRFSRKVFRGRTGMRARKRKRAAEQAASDERERS